MPEKNTYEKSLCLEKPFFFCFSKIPISENELLSNSIKVQFVLCVGNRSSSKIQKVFLSFEELNVHKKPKDFI